MEALFVYGTLRRGAAQHRLLAGARVLGPATWQGRLYSLGPYPGAVPSPDPADAVRGELYALRRDGAAQLLERLDRYEGPDFRRERSAVALPDGSRRPSWIYVYAASVAGLRRIASGDFLTPAARGDPRA